MFYVILIFPYGAKVNNLYDKFALSLKDNDLFE